MLHPMNDQRYYHLCGSCHLIFADPSFFLNLENEKKRYQYHQNSREDAGYVAFLNRAIKPAGEYLIKGMVGLDYGCGPVPTLSGLVEAIGYRCYDYDPVFGFNHPLLEYDFIFSTEAFEHFHHPDREINNIVTLVRQGGIVTIMTERWNSEDQFQSWYYKNDPTHVCFFHDKTFDYICKRFGLTNLYDDGSRVVILRKSFL